MTVILKLEMNFNAKSILVVIFAQYFNETTEDYSVNHHYSSILVHILCIKLTLLNLGIKITSTFHIEKL